MFELKFGLGRLDGFHAQKEGLDHHVDLLEEGDLGGEDIGVGVEATAVEEENLAGVAEAFAAGDELADHEELLHVVGESSRGVLVATSAGVEDVEEDIVDHLARAHLGITGTAGIEDGVRDGGGRPDGGLIIPRALHDGVVALARGCGGVRI